MKFFKALGAVFHRGAAAPAKPVKQDSVGLFFYGPAPSAEHIAEIAASAQVSTQVEPSKRTRISIAWPDVALTVTIDPEWAAEKDYQLSCMREWLDLFNSTEEQREVAHKLSAELENTSTCYGSVVTPAFDEQAKAVGLLKTLIAETGGCFFSRQTFYDAQGIRIIGRPGNPGHLGSV